jgi:uncharacterized protein (UPF0261 family)
LAGVKGVLILATLDTKGPEALYLCDKIKALGEEPILIDMAMRDEKRGVRAEVSAEEVARAGGRRLAQLSDSDDLDVNMEVMVAGAVKIIHRLMREGRVNGVIGIGGYRGSFMATAIMHSLPFGLPKVMVSSAAAIPGLSTRFFKTSDIMIFHSVIEVAGLTNLLKNVLDRAAYALSGMLQGQVATPIIDQNKGIAMTMVGPCEICAKTVRTALGNQGYQVIGFHATGIGDRAMEEMIAEGFLGGVIDLATGGVGEHLYGFMRDAGPNRLESAAKVGIPQIISTCGVNHITPSKSKYTAEHKGRRRYDLDKSRTWLRMTPNELKEVSEVFAEKLNKSLGLVKVVIPLKGWSSIDSPGRPTYDPEEDAIFIKELSRRLKKEIEVIQVDANMEDPEFAKAVISAALDVLK